MQPPFMKPMKRKLQVSPGEHLVRTLVCVVRLERVSRQGARGEVTAIWKDQGRMTAKSLLFVLWTLLHN